MGFTLHVFSAGLLTAALVLALATPAVADDDLPDDPAQNPTVATDVMPDRCTGGRSIPSRAGACRLTPVRFARPTVVLWGDSHAWQHIPGLRAEANARDVNLIAFVMGACPPVVVPDRRPLSACVKSSREAVAYVARLRESGRSVRVVVGAHWQFYRKLNARLRHGWQPTTETDRFRSEQARLFARGSDRMFRTLGRLKVRTAVLGQAPWVPGNRPACEAGELPYQCELPRSRAIAGEAGVRTWLSREMTELRRPWSIDVTSRLCDADICRPELGGVDTYLDDLHLNPQLSLQLRRHYVPALRFPASAD